MDLDTIQGLVSDYGVLIYAGIFIWTFFEGETFVIDTDAPVVTSIVRTGGAAALVNGGPIRFTVTFSEPVTGDVAGTFAVDAGRGVTPRAAARACDGTAAA